MKPSEYIDRVLYEAEGKVYEYTAGSGRKPKLRDLDKYHKKGDTYRVVEVGFHKGGSAVFSKLPKDIQDIVIKNWIKWNGGKLSRDDIVRQLSPGGKYEKEEFNLDDGSDVNW